MKESVDAHKRNKSLIDKIIEDAKNDELFFGCLFLGLGFGMLFDKCMSGALLGIGLWIIIKYYNIKNFKKNKKIYKNKRMN